MSKLFKRPIFLLIITTISLVIIFGCSGSGSGENAVIILNIGGNPGKAVSIGDLRHEITFSGPTGVKTYSVTGAGSVSATVVAGQWAITVQAYFGDDLYAIGSETVEVKAGKSTSVLVQMTVVWTDTAGVPIQTPTSILPDVTVNDWAALQTYVHGLPALVTNTTKVIERTIMLDDLGSATAFSANASTINIPDTTLGTGEEIKVTLVAPQGKTVTLTRGTNTVEMFNVGGVGSKGTLNLGDLNYPQNSILVFDGAGPSVTESLIYVASNSVLNMYKGVTLKNNENTSSPGYGGAVNVAGTFNMYGGTIGPDNKADSGGGVYLDDGVFNLVGGDIKGNEAQTGGGVYAFATTGSTDEGLYMAGGTIGPNNTASIWGGGVYIEEAELVMTSGEIIGNKALPPFSGSAQGGGVYLTHTTGSAFVFEMSGTAKINGNYAIDAGGYGAGGGGVFIANGTNGQLKMQDSAEICNNTAQASGSNPAQGGGVYFYRTSATFDMVSGTPKINGNTAVNDTGIAQGGGVYMEDGTFTMSAGEINGNTADGNSATGGGVYVDFGSGASFTKSGGTILPNIIQYSGPFLPNLGEAVYVDNGGADFGCDGPVPDGVSTSLIPPAPGYLWDFP